MMTLRVCNTCHKHLINTIECPECAADLSTALPGRTFLIGALLGLSLTACGDKEGEDTAAEPSSETEPAEEALYGVAEEPEE